MNIIFNCLEDEIKIEKDLVIKEQKVHSNHIKGCLQCSA